MKLHYDVVDTLCLNFSEMFDPCFFIDSFSSHETLIYLCNKYMLMCST